MWIAPKLALMNQTPVENWVDRLTADEEQRGIALSELRVQLILRLHRAFVSNPNVNEAFIEDAVQDSLVAIMDSLDQFQGRSQFTTWASTIAVRIVLAELRRRRWQDVSLEQLLEQNAVWRGSQDGTQTELQKTELVAELHRVIAEKLTDKQRMVLQAELQGMPQEEIGRRLGSNRNAIYKLTHDARKRVRAGMIEAGYSAEDLAIVVGVSR